MVVPSFVYKKFEPGHSLFTLVGENQNFNQMERKLCKVGFAQLELR